MTLTALDDVNFILSCINPVTGAITQFPDKSRIDPYKSGYAVMGLADACLLLNNVSYAAPGWAHLQWHQSKMDVNGYITFYNVDVFGVETSTGDFDAVDAWAGMFLVAAYQMWCATKDIVSLNALHTGITKAVHAINTIICPDGLPSTSPATMTYHAALMLDVAETYGGLHAAYELATILGDNTLKASANSMLTGMIVGIESLYHAGVGTYAWGRNEFDGTPAGDAISDLTTYWLPDVFAQYWPMAFNVPIPEARRVNLLSVINTAHPIHFYNTGGSPPPVLAAYPWYATQGTNEQFVVPAWCLNSFGERHNALLTIRQNVASTGRIWPYNVSLAGQCLHLELLSTPFIGGIGTVTISFQPLPFGLRDVRLYPLTGETPGAGVDLPNARTFSFAEAETFQELRGDDSLIAVHGVGPTVNWELEGGGVSFEAVKTMFGGTIVETGSSPNGIKSYTKSGNDVRPYFQVEGQALSDSGGDFHVLLYRARATGELSAKLNDSAFLLTTTKGQALPRISDKALYKFVQNETVTAIP